MAAVYNTIYFEERNCELTIKRDDLLHQLISGNKFRKLKYNLKAAAELGHKTLLTFGGAYSNHISAVAAAGNEYGFNTVGVIRGEEIAAKMRHNPTLTFARNAGMTLHFVSRDDYRKKDSANFINNLKNLFGPFYLLPEGGTNALAVKGCEEILSDADVGFDYICCAVGTGGTIAGISNSAFPEQKVLGFPALRSNDLEADVNVFCKGDNVEIIRGYEFGGYGRISTELVQFLNCFYEKYQIPLDPLYTGKMIFGVNDMILNGKFPAGSRILAIHTGGLQGIAGMNNMLKSKNLPLLKYD